MPLAGRDAVDRLPALQAMAIGMAGAPVAHERVPSRRRSLGTVRIRRNRTA
jgi:hypothetical protein